MYLFQGSRIWFICRRTCGTLPDGFEECSVSPMVRVSSKSRPSALRKESLVKQTIAKGKGNQAKVDKQKGRSSEVKVTFKDQKKLDEEKQKKKVKDGKDGKDVKNGKEEKSQVKGVKEKQNQKEGWKRGEVSHEGWER